MKLYNLEDAKYLIEYYAPLVVGKIIEPSTEVKGKRVEKVFVNVDKYSIEVVGTGIRVFPQSRRSIELVAKDLNLTPPDQVLKNRDQP